MLTKFRILILAALFSVAISNPATAQPQSAYPNRPIRLVVPFAPGAGTDLSIRTIAPTWSETLGKQIVIDNRAGASGIMGTSIVAKAVPDGYTLLFTSSSFAVNTTLFSSLPYDALKDFAPVGHAVSFPYFLVVNSELPVKSVQDLVALAKAKPGSLNYGSTGSGTAPHISAELFKQLAKVDIVHVPYKGSAESLIAVISGQIQLMFVNSVSAIPHVRAGRLRALGISTARRGAAIAPDVPTIAEAVPGYLYDTWAGVVAPAGTPREIIARLNRDLVHTLGRPDVRVKLEAQGAEVKRGAPEEFAKLIATDTERLGRVVTTGKMRAD